MTFYVKSEVLIGANQIGAGKEDRPGSKKEALEMK